MAKITKDQTRICTTAEAVSLVKNADGRVRFMVGVQVFLPTTENRGFPGVLCARSKSFAVPVHCEGCQQGV